MNIYTLASFAFCIWLTACANTVQRPAAQRTKTPQPPLYINEILAHTDLPALDAIELYNDSDQDIDIGGWFLSDESGARKKVQLPRRMVVPAQGFLVLDERHFGLGVNGFRLSKKGEAVYLSAATAHGELTGAVVSAHFGASPNGVSFGRIHDSYVLLEQPTLGQPNAEPKVGPIVISEIKLAQDGVTADYILFESISYATTLLYDEQFPQNRWRLSGVVGHTFESGIQVAPFEQFVLSSNPEQTRSQTTLPVYSLPPDAIHLDAGQITLSRPESPDNDSIAYITVDHVDFNTIQFANWDKDQALQRQSLTVYGNHLDNWQKVIPTFEGTAP